MVCIAMCSLGWRNSFPSGSCLLQHDAGKAKSAFLRRDRKQKNSSFRVEQELQPMEQELRLQTRTKTPLTLRKTSSVIILVHGTVGCKDRGKPKFQTSG